MPLVILATMLLLLSSLAVQSAMLQLRARRSVLLELRQAEDQLSSAAHQLVGRLQQEHPCLLALPLAQWSAQGALCADAAQQLSLIAAAGFGPSWRLISWSPDASASAVSLLLEQPAAAGQPSRRGAFRVRLAHSGGRPQVQGLRFLGLRGLQAP